MSPAEVAWRTRDEALQLAWSRRQVRREQLVSAVSLPAGERRFTAVLRPDTAARVPEEARKAVLEAANGLLRGEWEVLGVARTDLVLPDWFSVRSAVRSRPLRLPHRSPLGRTGRQYQAGVGDLAPAAPYAPGYGMVSHRGQAYAQRVAEQLRSWWQENPFLSGVNWTSGIELGIRLISLAWIRRLLADWPDVADLFERDALAVHQIRWHQQYLAAFPSRGSSANHPRDRRGSRTVRG